MRLCLITLLALPLLLFGSEKASAEGVLESIVKRNLPKNCRLEVLEKATSPTGIAEVSRFSLFIEERGKTAGIRYRSSPLNPRKSILFNNYGMDIWTLDSLRGRVRKIPHHKKKEPVNGTLFTYWDCIPYILTHVEYQIKQDTVTADGARLLRLDPGSKSAYGEVRFYVDAGSLRLKRIALYSLGLKRTKTMDFKQKRGRRNSGFPFQSIVMKQKRTGSKTQHIYISADTKAKVPQSIKNIPRVR